MPDILSYGIQFDGVSLAQAGEYAKQLASTLNDVGEGADVARSPGGEGSPGFRGNADSDLWETRGRGVGGRQRRLAEESSRGNPY